MERMGRNAKRKGSPLVYTTETTPGQEAEKLGEVPLYSTGFNAAGAPLPGRAVADLVREADPDGTVVVHARRSDTYIHDRLLRTKSISPDMHQAGEVFRSTFERARLIGHMPAVSLERASRGPSIMKDATVFAKKAIEQALATLGVERGRGSMSLTASAMWFTVGDGQTVDAFVQRCRSNGWSMDERKATGLIISGLERLAIHYRLTSTGDLKDQAEQRGFARGLRTAVDFLAMAANEARVYGRQKEAKALRSVADDMAKRYGVKKETHDG